jgi:DsbC/DsbD-like thiol-disulfide interchange protein
MAGAFAYAELQFRLRSRFVINLWKMASGSALSLVGDHVDRFREKIVMRELLSRALVCLIAGVTFLWAALAAAQQYNGKELVKATLMADVSSIQPGQQFRLGVLYRIEPGWHIYWKYPGDSGIPTKIEWQLPQGFTIRDLQWPLPLREKEPGDLEVFAYTSEVLLFADVKAPATLPTRLRSSRSMPPGCPKS